jgi:hypothetical protein
LSSAQSIQSEVRVAATGVADAAIGGRFDLLAEQRPQLSSLSQRAVARQVAEIAPSHESPPRTSSPVSREQ